ncbi:MAG: SOS response-associated peptidase [Bacteroidales bacterium]|nr:SOS response-associated peptidase [Bacteroidales bacterium]
MLDKKYESIEDVSADLINHDDPYKDWIVNYNGFAHPDVIVVANTQPNKLQLMNWGLIPFWAKDRTIQNSTLNAKIETLNEKPSFKYSINNRCLIFADGFFEWQWLDEKGKNKQKYLLALKDESPFAFAGLWNAWSDKSTGEQLKTFTILTTEANKLLSEIHNSKKRMPVIVSNETKWLMGEKLEMNNDLLKAIIV